MKQGCSGVHFYKLAVVGLLAFMMYFTDPVANLVPGAAPNGFANIEAQAQRAGGRNRGPGRRRGRSAPEINGPAGLSVLALLGCIIMVFRSRSKP